MHTSDTLFFRQERTLI
uniref:Uncharacterized protein n=1 Tax=Anguilla anguilla TaxID=7936 RepID=A0A0E9VSV9_ANGAN